MNRFYFSFNSGLCFLFAATMSTLSTQVVAQESSHSAQASGEEAAPALGSGVCLADPTQRMWMIRSVPGQRDLVEVKDCGKFNLVKSAKDCASGGQNFTLSKERFTQELQDRMARQLGFKDFADVQGAGQTMKVDKEQVKKMRAFLTGLKGFDDKPDAETRAEVDALMKKYDVKYEASRKCSGDLECIEKQIDSGGTRKSVGSFDSELQKLTDHIFGLSGNDEALVTYNPRDTSCSPKGVQVLSSVIEDLKANKLLSSKKSNTGVSFETVGQENGKDIVKDTKTGLTWYPALEKRLNWADAKAACEKRGLRLPTKDEFTLGERDGIRSMHADFKDRFFWSSSVYVNYNAWGFYGGNGNTYRENRVNKNSVRCVR
jgi:hypothetical protein